MITSIAVDFFQVLSLFGQIGIVWPSPISDILEVMSLFNFNPEIVAPECTVEMEYSTKWYISMAIPFVSLIFIILCQLCILYAKPAILGESLSNHDSDIISKGTNALVSISTICYLSITKRSFEIFDCIELNGEMVMRASPINVCHEASGIHDNLKPWAYASLIIYGLGIPSTFGFIISCNLAKVRSDQKLRIHGFGDTKESNPHWAFRRKYYQLYYRYSANRWWWFIVPFVRKFCFAAVMVLLDRKDGNLLQATGGLFVLFIAYAGQMQFQPYIKQFLDEDNNVLDDRNKDSNSEVKEVENKGIPQYINPMHSTHSLFLRNSIKVGTKTSLCANADHAKTSAETAVLAPLNDEHEKTASKLNTGKATKTPAKIQGFTEHVHLFGNMSIRKVHKSLLKKASHASTFVNDLNLLDSVLLFSSIYILIIGMTLQATASSGKFHTFRTFATMSCVTSLVLCSSYLGFLIFIEIRKGFHAAKTRKMIAKQSAASDDIQERGLK